MLRSLVVTPYYIDPEVQDIFEDDAESYTNTVDVWASGIISYELVAGTRPFPNTSAFRKYCYCRLEFPQSPLVARGLSPSGISFLKTLLNPHPKSRPTAANALEDSWLKYEDEQKTSLARTNALEDSCLTYKDEQKTAVGHTVVLE